MSKSACAIGFGLALLLTCLVALSGSARAAGEWEWTEGQGWIRGAGVARPTPKEQLHYAYDLEQKGEFMDAARQYFLLVQNFPSSEEAGVGLQRLARCLFEMENYYTSYKAIEQVIETYPNTGRMSDLVEIELQIAKRLMQSQTPDILSGREENIRNHNIQRGLEIIESVIEHDPYGPVAAEAYLVKGEGNLLIGEINTARTAFETIRDEFPRSDFYERARLGILQCDSLVGQANPREVREQIEVVRQAERERSERMQGDDENYEDVEDSIRQLAEVEAQKMMDQAEQYRRMGTRDGVKASEFLYKEIVRRYPGTIQAEDSMARLGNIRMPPEQSRIVKTLKNINLNPFTYNKDKEPPWIVPQLDPEDMVMVDSGVGPIIGVPETGLPSTDYSATVRPAALPDQPELPPASRNFTPITAGPPSDSAAAFGEAPRPGDPNLAAAPGSYSAAFGPEAPRTPPPNPLSTASEADLVGAGGAATGLQIGAGAGAGQGGYVHPYDAGGIYASAGQPQNPNQYYDNTPILPAGTINPPSLGSPVYHTPYSDLVGAPPVQQQPMGGYGYNTYNGYYPPQPQQQPYGNYGEYQSYENYGGYQQPYDPVYQNQTYPAPAVTPPAPAPAYGGGYTGSGNGGWTFGEDLR
ncbi:MAG: tetratricopeptide repeat protein [Planctomycetaceae bacterium]|nr:tetratricopeptide repeat protein [Planctomycetaceae bacterium]